MLAPALFRRFRDVAYSQAGIALKDGKETLVESRIGKRLTALGLPDAEAYADFLEAHAEDEVVQFLDVISTNFTSFYREPDHFELLTEHATQWLEAGQQKVRVWCAASSTGEEPYTLLMTLDQVLGGQVDWKILATDISTRVLDAARKGAFPEERLAGVPSHLKHHYFERIKRPGVPDEWQIRASYREHVTFGRLNLSHVPYPLSGPLDAVFCRNVMIYFDAATRQTVVTQAERLLRPGGLLVIGHAETLNGLNTRLQIVRPSVFRKPL